MPHGYVLVAIGGDFHALSHYHWRHYPLAMRTLPSTDPVDNSFLSSTHQLAEVARQIYNLLFGWLLL